MPIACKGGTKATDRHIGDGDEAGKNNAVLLQKIAPVVRFQGTGIGGQMGAEGIVDQIEYLLGVMAKAKRVEFADGGDGILKCSWATLSIHIAFQIAGERTCQGHISVAEEKGHLFQSWFQMDCEIGTDLDADFLGHQGIDEIGQVGIEFGGTAGDIHHRAA